MKLYISADIEGVAGVVSRDQGGPEAFEYAHGRSWMTREVRAACEAALSEGWEEVIVSDSHGNGQNLLLDELPRGVRVVRSWPRPLAMMEGVDEKGVGAAMLIGYHAGSTNEGGGLSHTLYGLVIREVRLNEVVASEGMISAATAGHFGVPICFVSGDDAFVTETRGFLPGVRYVETKTSHSTLSATTMLPEDACEAIREEAAVALQDTEAWVPMVVDKPVRVEIDFKHRLPAEMLDYLPDIERTGAYTVEHVAADMPAVSRFLSFVTQYSPTSR